MAGQSTLSCAIIQASGDQLSALQSGWISLSQRLPTQTAERTFLCGFDIVIWQPAWAHGGRSCPMQLSAGSTAMDGRLGAIQRFDSCSEPLGALYLLDSPPLSPPTTTVSPPPPKQIVISERHASNVILNEYELFQQVKQTREQNIDNHLFVEDALLNFALNITIREDFPPPSPPPTYMSVASSYYTYRQLSEDLCFNGTSVHIRIRIVYNGDIDAGKLLDALKLYSTNSYSYLCESVVEESDDAIMPPPSPPPFPPTEDDTMTIWVVTLAVLCALSCCVLIVVVIVCKERNDDEDEKEKLVKEEKALKLIEDVNTGSSIRGRVISACSIGSYSHVK